MVQGFIFYLVLIPRKVKNHYHYTNNAIDYCSDLDRPVIEA